ncbi:hypothetical protein ACS0TY_024301 [Phlomoides rotata]
MSTSSSEEVGGGEGPSRRRRMSMWPEPFVEALAFRVAIDADGRLAAAHALFNIFQVCSTWRAISRSELLWQNLTRHIWNTWHLRHNTWREEYIYRHRTFNNFRRGRYMLTTLPFNIPSDNGLSCRRLVLSDHHLAAGFSDGAVRLFYLPTGLHLSTFYPQHRDRLGRFSSSVSGIILSDVRLVFATLDGDIHATIINGQMLLRRAHIGNVVNDGALVDFTGSNRWWVGLYAGVPGRAFHIWNGETEELVFVGGTLTDAEALMGWHLLTEITDLIGRVRVTSYENAIACTSSRVIVFDLQDQGVVLHEEEFVRGVIVGCFDCNDEAALITDRRGAASLRRLVSLEEVCRFRVRGGRVLGCVNSGYGVIITAEGVIRVWEIEGGDYLYHFRERMGECNAIVCDDRYVAAVASSTGIIHLWDFGAQ